MRKQGEIDAAREGGCQAGESQGDAEHDIKHRWKVDPEPETGEAETEEGRSHREWRACREMILSSQESRAESRPEEEELGGCGSLGRRGLLARLAPPYKLPEKVDLKDGRFILAHGFRPQSAGRGAWACGEGQHHGRKCGGATSSCRQLCPSLS